MPVVKVPTRQSSNVSIANHLALFNCLPFCLDFINKIHLEENIYISQGTTLRSELRGEVNMKSFLDGCPQLKVGLNDDLVIGAKEHENKGKLLNDLPMLIVGGETQNACHY